MDSFFSFFLSFFFFYRWGKVCEWKQTCLKLFIFNKCEKKLTFDAVEIYFPPTDKAGRLKT